MDAGIKQAELAHRLGVSQSEVSKYEAGERGLDLVALRAICIACGSDIQTFVDRFERNTRGRGDASG